MKKRLVGSVILIGLILVGWQIYQKAGLFTKETVRPIKPPVAVEAQPIVTTTIREVEVFSGTLLPESLFNVAPKISGRLEKLLVNIGDEIKQGQLIAVLDDDEFAQQVDQARAELDVARANIEENRSTLNLKRREFERAESLREKKIVSVAELDAAEAQYKAALARQKVAEAQVAQKEAELKTNEIRLSYTRIKAAWKNGSESRVVGERFVDEGVMLTANSPIVSIIDISCLRAVIHVIEKDYPRVKTDQRAIITTDAFPGRTFEGSIARIAPLLKEEARQARVEIDIPNPERLLKPGMFVRVEIEFARHDNATVVPIDSMIKNNGQWGIFIAEPKTMRVQFVTVTPGIINGRIAEIVKPQISGLVVTVGHHLLEDGSPISLPAERKKTSS
ncbi:MAG TPA: efflux RND transporter periplasmic adaptor subunit [Syntrophales bacterium]|nr:efflux RND transporter periplasmic adaptor subunit [Syntrophales bacterium]